MKKFLFLITHCAFLIANCLAAELQFRWNTEVTNALPYAANAFQGETFTLDVGLKQYGQDLTGEATATFYWQTKEMAAEEWYSTEAVWDAVTGRASVDFTPAMDTGATAYRFFFGIESTQGKNYRAYGTLRLKPSPGFNPATLAKPDIYAALTADILADVFAQTDAKYQPLGDYLTEESDPIYTAEKHTLATQAALTEAYEEAREAHAADISTLQEALETKAPLENPAFTGTRAPHASSPTDGKSLGGFIGGMILHEGFTALTSSMANFNPAKRREANFLGSIGGGALAGATAGMALGPIGAGVGAVIGAATGYITALGEEAKNTREALFSLKEQTRQFKLDSGMKREDRAFAQTLTLMTREQRDEAIGKRADEIRFGDGDLSIRNLESWLMKETDAGRTDTEAYRQKSGALSKQYARLGALQEMDDQNFFQALPDRLSANNLTDSLQKMGGTVGGTVNIDTANRELVSLSREMLSALRKIADTRTDATSGINAASHPFTPAYAGY